jgi:8-oxo-dGTP pyrophosphatase MutT (NUDIX family)
VERHKKIATVKLANTNFRIMKMQTVGLLVVRDRKLLLAFSNNKQCFYLPGGKKDSDETAEQALCREIKEELNVKLQEKNLKYYMHISAPAYGEMNGTVMEQDCYFVDESIEPKACAEIGGLKFFSVQDYLSESNQAPGAVMALQKLKSDDLID